MKNLFLLVVLVLSIGITISNAFTIESDSEIEKSKISLGNNYFKDGNYIYYNDTLIKEADINSFKTLGYDLAKDYLKVYRKHREMKDIISDNFKVLNPQYGKNNKYVYYLKASSAIKIEADHESFKVFSTKDKFNSMGQPMGFEFAQDKTSVFFKGEVWKDLTEYTGNLKHLGSQYFKDDLNVYFNDEVVENVDINTFEVICDNYSKDLKNVYYKEKLLLEADPDTFQGASFLGNFPRLYGGHVSPQFEDKSFIYRDGKIIGKSNKNFEFVMNYFEFISLFVLIIILVLKSMMTFFNKD